MVNKTTQKRRQYKIEWIKDTITAFFVKNPDKKIDMNKLLAEFMFANNSTIRTGKEILFALEVTKFIKIEDGKYINIIKK